MFRKHKSLSILAVCLLIFQLSILPSITLGDDKPNSTTGTSSSKPVISLEQAVEIVKNNFSIPAEYSRFSSGYNDYNNRAVYSLNWDAIEEPHGSFRAEVDAKTGEIVNMNRWDGSKQTSFAIPVLSAGEAEKIAAELVV
ncbi:MAG: PepSY domain-containing protein, partial [Desulfitobacterium hafniense]|nr:PepSY domain-containing protein [Desulfitobacterium hafniense]